MPRTIVLIFLIFSMITTAFLAVWQRNEMIQIGYQTESLQQKKKQGLRLKKELVGEIASLSAVERIEKIALEQLHMKPPDPGQRIIIASREKNRSSDKKE